MRGFIVAGISAVLLTALPPVAAGEEAVSGLRECREIADSEKRLACYDALAEEFRSGSGNTGEPTDPELDSSGPGDDGVAAEPAAPEAGEPPQETVSPTEETGAPQPEAEVAPGEAKAGDAAPSGSRQERVATPEDLSIPHRGRIESFASNRRGDYRFRISEGIVFERAGGPGIPSADLTGASVTLSRNFLGQWRARVEGQPRELWVSPVDR